MLNYDEKKSVFAQFETRNDYLNLVNAVKGYYANLDAFQGVLSDYCLQHNGEPITDEALRELNVRARWTCCSALRYVPSDFAIRVSITTLSICVSRAGEVVPMDISSVCPQYNSLYGYYFAGVFDYDTCVVADDNLRNRASEIIANYEYVADNWYELKAKTEVYCDVARTLLKGLHPLCVTDGELPTGIVTDVRAWCKERVKDTREIDKSYDELLNKMYEYESENK